MNFARLTGQGDVLVLDPNSAAEPIYLVTTILDPGQAPSVSRGSAIRPPCVFRGWGLPRAPAASRGMGEPTIRTAGDHAPNPDIQLGTNMG